MIQQPAKRTHWFDKRNSHRVGCFKSVLHIPDEVLTGAALGSAIGVIAVAAVLVRVGREVVVDRLGRKGSSTALSKVSIP